MTNVSLQNRIREIMKKKKLTQKELANIIGISQPALSLYLGGRTPPVKVLLHIAKFADTTIEWLLTGQDLFKSNQIREAQQPYGTEAVLMNLWHQLPKNIQQDLLNLMQHILH
jgi:transcriptional regulator with XRE-family HTH domain